MKQTNVLTNINTEVKISDTPTGVIIAKAFTGSEWDSVDFAIIPVSEEYKKFIQKAQEHALSMKQEFGSILHIAFSSDQASFYKLDEYLNTGNEETENPAFEVLDGFINGDTQEWSWIEISDELLELFYTPEQDIRYGQVKIYADSVQWVGYGKHTDEEFYISSIDIDQLLK